MLSGRVPAVSLAEAPARLGARPPRALVGHLCLGSEREEHASVPEKAVWPGLCCALSLLLWWPQA